jgi:hypothetical protein
VESKELFHNEWVSVKQIGKWVYSHFTKSSSETVGILPYRFIYGELHFGIVWEDIPCHRGTKQMYLMTGALENGDILETALSELKEEAGIVGTALRMGHLGTFYPLKHSDCKLDLICINVTGLTVGEPTGDGSEHEKNIDFKFVDGKTLVENTCDPNLIAAYALLMRKLGG